MGQLIPRILHQIWLGGSPIPEEFLEFSAGWRRHHPHWEYRLWTDRRLPRLVHGDVFRAMGPLAGKADLQAFRDMVKTVRDRVAKLKAEGKSKDDAKAAKPTADFDAKWGQGFIKGDMLVGMVFDSLP